jgi:hypothetical protein
MPPDASSSVMSAAILRGERSSRRSTVSLPLGPSRRSAASRALISPRSRATAERGRELEVVDPQGLQVDVEGQLEAAAGGRALLLLFLRHAQHGDLRCRQELDAQPALQERCERPGKARILDLQPRAPAVGEFDARQTQVCRHETVDAGEADLLIRRGGEAGGHGRQ